MQLHQILGAGYVAIGMLLIGGGALVARWLVALIAEATARAVPTRGRHLARAGANLLGLSLILIGVAALVGPRWLIYPLATLLMALLIYLPVRLARLGDARN